VYLKALIKHFPNQCRFCNFFNWKILNLGSVFDYISRVLFSTGWKQNYKFFFVGFFLVGVRWKSWSGWRPQIHHSWEMLNFIHQISYKISPLPQKNKLQIHHKSFSSKSSIHHFFSKIQQTFLFTTIYHKKNSIWPHKIPNLRRKTISGSIFYRLFHSNLIALLTSNMNKKKRKL
jgi:hypothetical protein